MHLAEHVEPTGGKDEATMRRCIVTGTSRPKAELLRFVVSPQGAVVPDIRERLPGRGLWLTARRDIVAAACGKGLFAKAARASVEVPADLADQVEALLARRCCDLLGLARRAGAATYGFEKVRAWLRAGKCGLLFAASDGAEDGRRKLRALAGDTPVTTVLRADEMAAGLGREHTVHVAVRGGKLALMLHRETARLSGFRTQPCGPETTGNRRRKSKVHEQQ